MTSDPFLMESFLTQLFDVNLTYPLKAKQANL